MDTDTVSVGEAARILGVHRNTVHYRIKKQRLTAVEVVASNGVKEYRIPVSALPKVPEQAAHEVPRDFAPNAATMPNTEALVSETQREQFRALLGPFLAEIGQVRQALGRTEAERDNAREQLAAVELERDRLREQVETLKPRRSWWKRIWGE
jgi:excisionase family DNA binding protein